MIILTFRIKSKNKLNTQIIINIVELNSAQELEIEYCNKRNPTVQYILLIL